MTRRTLIAAVALSTFTFTLMARADIIEVPGDHATIQAAIDAAVNGDEVVVSPGVYNEQVNLLGKAIVLRSTMPTDPAIVQTTIIDGAGLSGSLITCQSSETEATVISGLTVRNGTASPDGGGLYVDSARPRVTFCRFIENSAPGRGGAVYATGVNPEGVEFEVTDCHFEDNESVGQGGAIYVDQFSPDVLRCTFNDNESTDSSGGAIYFADAAGNVEDCSFHGNRAASEPGGVRVTDGTITNCSFNETARMGYTAVNSTITGVTVQNGVGGGADITNSDLISCTFRSIDNGALECHGTCLIDDCTFIDNFRANRGGAIVGGSKLTIRRSRFHGNDSDNYGSAISFEGGTISIDSSVFSGNKAPDAIFCRQIGSAYINNTVFIKNQGRATHFRQVPVIEIRNCTFAANGVAQTSYHCTPTFANCIIWNAVGLESANVRFSNVLGGFPGNGNIDEVPFFRNLNGPDGVLGTLDDDVRLRHGSPCFDAGSNTFLASDRADLDNDNDLDELVPFDFDGNPRLVDVDGDGTATVTMGAFEIPYDDIDCPYDIDGSGGINVNDMLAVLAAWGDCDGCPEDLNGDDDVNVEDLLLILANWGDCD